MDPNKQYSLTNAKI